MKKLLILLASVALTTGVASAQTTNASSSSDVQRPQGPRGGDRQQRTPEQMADARAQQLTKQLNLNADQSAKIHQLTLEQAQEMQAKRAQNQADRKAMGADRDRYEAQLKDILTADQYTKYTQERQERMSKTPKGGGKMKVKS